MTFENVIGANVGCGVTRRISTFCRGTDSFLIQCRVYPV